MEETPLQYIARKRIEQPWYKMGNNSWSNDGFEASYIGVIAQYVYCNAVGLDWQEYVQWQHPTPKGLPVPGRNGNALIVGSKATRDLRLNKGKAKTAQSTLGVVAVRVQSSKSSPGDRIPAKMMSKKLEWIIEYGEVSGWLSGAEIVTYPLRSVIPGAPPMYVVPYRKLLTIDQLLSGAVERIEQQALF